MPDYDFYLSIGGKLGEEDFLRLSSRGWAYLEALTMGRVNGTLSPKSAERVKSACCALTDEYAAQEKGGEVISASNDGYQETYAASGSSPARRLYDAAVLYLAPTGLLYAGMGGCCCAGLY